MENGKRVLTTMKPDLVQLSQCNVMHLHVVSELLFQLKKTNYTLGQKLSMWCNMETQNNTAPKIFIHPFEAGLLPR